MARRLQIFGGYAVMLLYNFLDVISTVEETLVLLVITECFNKTPRFQRIVSRTALFVSYTSYVICLTYLTDLGAFKLFILLPAMVATIRLCYKISFHESLVIMELSYVLITMLPEAVGVSFINFVYQGHITNTIDNVPVAKWEVYVSVIVIRCVCLIAAYYLFRNFRYHVQREDAAILTVGFLLAFGFCFASTYGYLNLHTEDTLTLDLATSVLCVYFIVQFLYAKNVSYLREQEQRDKMRIAQLQQQYAYYQEKQKSEERIRSVYHDMKNHLLVLENGQSTEATKQMARELRLQIADYENYIHTGNSFLDIIIRDKSEKTREKDIDFSVSIDFDGIDFLEPLDISTLFGNGIDNAIEASEKLSEEQRVIVVKAAKVQNFLPILIENNCADNPRSDSRTTKTDKFLHGFGISNMRKTAEKYGGQLTTKYENGRFTLKILIPVP